MNLSFPDWVPWWVPLLLLLPALLYGLAFLFMPFSVIGLKSRLEGIEARLDELQQDIRSLSVHGPDPGGSMAEFDDLYAPPPVAPAAPREREPTIDRPPIPPAPHALYDHDLPDDRPPPPPHTRPVRRGEPPPAPRQEPRMEPRVNWPR
jgi:hypothetical protein